VAGCEVWAMACPEHGTVWAAQCAQCAQSVHKECTKCAERTNVHTLSQECTIKMSVREIYQNVDTVSSPTFN
jgi:hypothetical protein